MNIKHSEAWNQKSIAFRLRRVEEEKKLRIAHAALANNSAQSEPANLPESSVHPNEAYLLTNQLRGNLATHVFKPEEDVRPVYQSDNEDGDETSMYMGGARMDQVDQVPERGESTVLRQSPFFDDEPDTIYGGNFNVEGLLYPKKE